jgi:hypothetical protein
MGTISLYRASVLRKKYLLGKKMGLRSFCHQGVYGVLMKPSPTPLFRGVYPLVSGGRTGCSKGGHTTPHLVASSQLLTYSVARIISVAAWLSGSR